MFAKKREMSIMKWPRALSRIGVEKQVSWKGIGRGCTGEPKEKQAKGGICIELGEGHRNYSEAWRGGSIRRTAWTEGGNAPSQEKVPANVEIVEKVGRKQ